MADTAQATITDGPVVQVGDPTTGVGDITVKEGEMATFGVKVSDAQANSTLTLTLGSGTADETFDFNTLQYQYSIDSGASWTTVPGNGQITLLAAGDHLVQVRTNTVSDNTPEPSETFTLGASLLSGTDTVADTAQATITDGPVIQVGDPINTNVMIMLDVSGSMDFKIDGVKIIETARAAIENMLDKYQENGPVKVKLGTFATDSRQLTEWVDVDTALRSLSELTPEGGTNYDAALVGIKTAFSNDSGKLENANNVSYFLSDGAPTLSSEYPDPGSGPGQNPGNVTNVNLGDGIFGQEISNWQTFVTDNNIKSYGVWIGDANDSQYLEPIAYDGVASSENPALVLTQPLDELLAALEDSVVTGQIFTGTAANNLIVSGLGDDLMTGNGGADSFIFDASTMNADALDADANTGGFDTDTITDFNDTADGDKLDLSDLLPDAANAGNLEQYLSFEKDASGTLIKVDANVSGTVDHVIKLENLDLTNDRNNSDTDIIKNLIDGNHLIID